AGARPLAARSRAMAGSQVLAVLLKRRRLGAMLVLCTWAQNDYKYFYKSTQK
ncbi:hypothetical protein LCGC14_2157410, partial [marine sediment metagenome]